MDDRTARSRATVARRLRRAGTWVALLWFVAAVGLLTAACGSASKEPGAAGGGGATTTTAVTSGSSASSSSSAGSSGESIQAEQLRFAQCMRANGVPDFPDPPADGAFLNALATSGVNTHTPTFQSALQACKKYNPAGNLTPAQIAADSAKGVEFAQCMRAHGVPNYPDPTTGPVGEQVMNLRGTGIDPSSPTVQAAASACGGSK